MSSSNAVATHILQFRIQYCSLALLYYDYALTLPLEVKYIWGQKLRLSTLLYWCCRYALIANLLFLLAIANKLGSSCDTWYKIISALSVLGRAAVLFTMTAKNFAIFGRNKYVLGYFMVIAVACIAMDISHVPGVKCQGSFSNVIVSDLLHILMLVAEYSAALFMLVRVYQAIKVNGGVWWNRAQRRGFMYLVFEQGVMYFSIVSIFTMASVVLNFCAPDWFLQRLLNALTLPITCLLTARFLLHLRVWEDRQTGGLSSQNESIELSTALEFEHFQASRGQETLREDILAPGIEDFGGDPTKRRGWYSEEL
ncbi:hypothetical protein C8J56DRAFT_912727 [Mycena floridula]|nr:hypothetical protein C8J56DRAFT_912727 [Mycena floridula]